jgi:hypothetical protein
MEGDVFYCDNQGTWNGSSSLKHLKPGGFVGNPNGNKFWEQAPNMGPKPADPKSGSRIETERKRIPQLVPTAVWLPHGKLGQSPTGIIPDHTKGAFGPFAGQVLVGEQTHSQVQRVFLEKINGVYQGAAFPFLLATAPASFLSSSRTTGPSLWEPQTEAGARGADSRLASSAHVGTARSPLRSTR